MTALNLKKGFTLIELLIVMAILGVLAVVVLVAINPVQQLARTRDAGRKSGITQIGHAAEAYYTAHGGSYMPNDGTWLSLLSSSGELSTIPQQIVPNNAASVCTTNIVSGWCYNANGSQAVVYTRLESQSENSKCTSGLGWFVYSTQDGRGGLVCQATAPTAGTQSFNATQ